MPKLAICFLILFSTANLAASQTPDQVAQKLFDAMKAHDATAASALFLPGATLSSVDAAGKASVTPFEKFVEAIRTSKSGWLERIWTPTILESDSIAVVWAEYDFHLNGAFHHCGIDSFQMLKTGDGWKINAISDTRQTSGCRPSPLGPPPVEHQP
jgi:hypothetical protein